MADRVRGWSCREAHESNPSPALASLGHPLPQGERVTEFAARRIVSLLVEYHSALMPPSFTTRSHLFISFTMCWPNSAELIFTTEAPSLANCFCTSGLSCTAVISRCSLSTIAGGVPAGATRPHQFTDS